MRSSRKTVCVFVIVENTDRQSEIQSGLQDDYEVRCYMTAREFLLDTTASSEGIAIATWRQLGMSGQDLDVRIQTERPETELIFISGAQDAPEVIRCSDRDFVMMPLDLKVLKTLVHQKITGEKYSEEFLAAAFKRLTGRERQVAAEIAIGKSSREIGEVMGVSTKTVEAHRAKIMAKARAVDVSEFVRMWNAYALQPV